MRADPRRGVGWIALAIQGDVEAHARSLARLGAEPRRVLREKDLDGLDALILPGGESTTIAKGLERLELYEPLQAFAARRKPVLGTCAGAILLAREVREPSRAQPRAHRRDGRAQRLRHPGRLLRRAAPRRRSARGLRCVFIRAPRLRDPGPDVEVLARVDGGPVLVRQGTALAATFHPELTDDLRVHRLLLSLV